MGVRGPAIDSVDPGGAAPPAAVASAPRPITRWRARIALGCLLGSGILITVAAAHTDSFLPESVRPVPSALAGLFGGLGLDLHVLGAIVLLAVMFVSYVVLAGESAHLSARSVILTIVALDVFVLLGPPLISTDVFSYQAYARMGADYAINPYLNGPHAIAYDEIERQLAQQPPIAVPTISIDGAEDGVRSPTGSASHARYFTGRMISGLLPAPAITCRRRRPRNLPMLSSPSIVGPRDDENDLSGRFLRSAASQTDSVFEETGGFLAPYTAAATATALRSTQRVIASRVLERWYLVRSITAGSSRRAKASRISEWS